MARILVVDQDKRARSFYERELGGRKHQVSAVASVHEGLRISQAWKPDLVVLDIEIPDWWEVQAIKSMLSVNREMPVLLTSTLSGDTLDRHSRTRPGRKQPPNGAVSLRQAVRDLLRPGRPDASGPRRRRRVATLTAPLLNAHGQAGHRARVLPLVAQAHERVAPAKSAGIHG